MALVIYKKTDKVWVDIADTKFAFSPLTIQEKQKLFSSSQRLESEEENITFAKDLLKLTLKDCDGIKNADGSDYKFSFDSNGNISDDNINDLINTDISALLITSASSLLAGMPSGDTIKNPATGEVLEGVKLVKKS